jgi:hypothetical protein
MDNQELKGIKRREKMKKIGSLTLVAFLMLLPIGAIAVSDPGEQYPGTVIPPDWLNPDYYQITPDVQYPGQGPYAQGYSTSLPMDAPVPTTPSSPESLGLQVPSETSAPLEAPQAGETEGMLLPASEGSARSLAPGAQFTDQAVMRMLLPPGPTSLNRFYVFHVPQTVASSSLYGWLPTWLQISSLGPARDYGSPVGGYGSKVWGYEWYPSGRLDCQFLGYASPGWHKRWFYADEPGWHILQYYCNGWSNYIYIYVYGWGPRPGPWPTFPDTWPWWSGSSGLHPYLDYRYEDWGIDEHLKKFIKVKDPKEQ